MRHKLEMASEFLRGVRKISAIVRAQRTDEKNHKVALKLLQIHDTLLELEECPKAASEVFSTAVEMALQTSYKDSLIEEVEKLIVIGSEEAEKRIISFLLEAMTEPFGES